ncbi:MAG: methyltransferase domain-containing protein [Bacteroidia bacterium]
MRIWIVKAIVQKAISILPGSFYVNFFFQKYVTRGVRLNEEYFEDKVSHCRKHWDAYLKYGGDIRHCRALEIGTGWYPIVPISLFLCGAERIVSVDINSHISDDRLRTVLARFGEYHRQGRLQQLLPHIRPDRWAKLNSVIDEREHLESSEILGKLSIETIVADARKLPYPENSFNLITSNNTFEHIYENLLRDILPEFVRIAESGGIMSHSIDMTDHFAHIDKSINFFNYLRFSDSQWKIIDNSVQPQSRLRITEYHELYRELNIPATEEHCKKGNPDELRATPLDERFKNIPFEELLKIQCTLVSKL